MITDSEHSQDVANRTLSKIANVTDSYRTPGAKLRAATNIPKRLSGEFAQLAHKFTVVYIQTK